VSGDDGAVSPVATFRPATLFIINECKGPRMGTLLVHVIVAPPVPAAKATWPSVIGTASARAQTTGTAETLRASGAAAEPG
jgi:hypothetical protein